MEKKKPTSATREIGKASLGEGSNGVVGTPTKKRIGLIWSYRRHPNVMR